MDKDYKEIKRMLEKFYEGISTQEEEAALSSFFKNTDTVPEALSADMKVFQALEDSPDSAPVPADLVPNIMTAINAASGGGKRGFRSIFRSKTFYITSAAIVALILMIPVAMKILTRTEGKDNLISKARVTQSEHLDSPEIIEEKAGALAYQEETEVKVKPVNVISGEKTEKHHYAKVEKASSNVGISPSATSENQSDEEEIILSEEELKAIQTGLAALEMAGRQFAYAQERINTTDKAVERSLNEIRNVLNN